MKKFRGQKRYYRKLLNKDLEVKFKGYMNYDSWFDMYHCHVDWRGYGNLSWKHRRQHLKALIREFEFLKTKLSNSPLKHQIFCVIDVKDSSQDAIYIHTPNPNLDNFPFQVVKSEDGMKLPPELTEWLTTIGYDWFWSKWERDNEVVYNLYLYDKNFGVSLRKDINA